MRKPPALYINVGYSLLRSGPFLHIMDVWKLLESHRCRPTFCSSERLLKNVSTRNFQASLRRKFLSTATFSTK